MFYANSTGSKIREVKSKFKFKNFDEYNARDTIFMCIFLSFGFFALFTFKQTELLVLSKDFYLDYRGVSAIYLAFFGSRNAVIIWALGNPKLRFQNIVNVNTISIIFIALLFFTFDILTSLYIFAVSATILGFNSGFKHINNSAIALSTLVFIIRGALLL